MDFLVGRKPRRLMRFRSRIPERSRPGISRFGRREAIDHLSGTDKIQFLAGDFFQIKIIVTQARYLLAQAFVFLLQHKVSFIESGLFTSKAPKMKYSALADDGVTGKQQNKRRQQIEG